MTRFWDLIAKLNRVWLFITAISGAILGLAVGGQVPIPAPALNWLGLVPIVSGVLSSSVIKSLPHGVKKIFLILAGLCGAFVTYAAARACGVDAPPTCHPFVSPAFVHWVTLGGGLCATLAHSLPVLMGGACPPGTDPPAPDIAPVPADASKR